MQHEPGGLLSHTDSAVQFVGADAVLRAGKQPERDEPLVKPERRILEDGPDLDRELASRMLFATLPAPLVLEVADL